jgi:vacuolar-type H+-ATPase subunit D/Vma8
MTHRTLDQLHQARDALKQRLADVNAEIREREGQAMSRLAKSYAKTIMAASKASGGELPSPEQLAALLAAPSAAAKASTRRRKPKAEA